MYTIFRQHETGCLLVRNTAGLILHSKFNLSVFSSIRDIFYINNDENLFEADNRVSDYINAGLLKNKISVVAEINDLRKLDKLFPELFI